MNILFLIAHPDDEAYGPYGTIAKLVNEGHKVHVFCLCDGRRPGNENVSADRVFAFKENCEAIGVQWKIWSTPDLGLKLNDTAHLVTQLIEMHKFDVVYAHNISDINQDHKIVGEAALIACRPKPTCTVNELYFFEVPSSTDWTFGKVQPVFQPTTYVDVSDYVETKIAALSNYPTETYEFPDARSIEAMTTLLKYRGYQVGFAHAEAFQLVYARVHKTP